MLFNAVDAETAFVLPDARAGLEVVIDTAAGDRQEGEALAQDARASACQSVPALADAAGLSQGRSQGAAFDGRAMARSHIRLGRWRAGGNRRQVGRTCVARIGCAAA